MTSKRGKVRKPGSNKAGAEQRYRAFVAAYLANGQNGTQAAITAGYASKGAHVAASRLLIHSKVKEIMGEMVNKAQAGAILTAELTIRELARIAYSDIRRLYRPDGTLKAPHEWDDNTAAAVSAIEGREELSEGVPVATLKRVKMNDKLGALKSAALILKLIDAPQEPKEVASTNDLEIARRILFVLDRPLRLRATVENDRS